MLDKLKKKKSFEVGILLISVMIVGICTIVYELLIGSISSYFLGDSVRQFSITIGLIMFAMGLGTYFSRLIQKNLIQNFIFVEVMLGVFGGLSVPILYAAFAYTDAYYPVMITMVFILGILIGIEIPLLTRILEKHYPLKLNISNVLSFDYCGALIATLLFPFVLLPFLGLFNSSIIIGMLNLLVGFLNLYWFKDKISAASTSKIKMILCSVSAILVIFLVFSQKLIYGWESSVYNDKIIFSQQTKYQKIVLTKFNNDFRLFLNGNLQFASVDEYRYHESLVHIPMSVAIKKENVLVLGGGDGLVARELLKYPEVKNITIIDLDPDMTDLAKENDLFKSLNKNSMLNPKVHIKNTDAFKFLEKNTNLYDVIIADLPDPNNSSLARMYSKEFYRVVNKHLSRFGVFVSQSTSPYFAPKAFWSINESIQESGFKYVYPYHAYVPSFGDWGFNLATNYPIKIDEIRISEMIEPKYLTPELVFTLFKFPKDSVVDVEPSTLNNPVILDYYLDGWKTWN